MTGGCIASSDALQIAMEDCGLLLSVQGYC
jgi:hypothetical protein